MCGAGDGTACFGLVGELRCGGCDEARYLPVAMAPPDRRGLGSGMDIISPRRTSATASGFIPVPM